MRSNVMQRVWLSARPALLGNYKNDVVSISTASCPELRISTTGFGSSRNITATTDRSPSDFQWSVARRSRLKYSIPPLSYGIGLGNYSKAFQTPLRSLLEHARCFNTSAGKRTWQSRRNKSSYAKDGEAKGSGNKSGDGSSSISSEASKISASSNTKTFMDRLPHLPTVNVHRPSKEELLAAATGFWSRMKVRFKWFSIRSSRPFNADEIGALLSWLFLGHIIWIIVGTTTFVSLAVLAVNTVFAQETLAQWVGGYLTKSTGITVVFESAIVPKWGDGVITFKNVFVSRRPGQSNARVTKGSPESAALAAAAAASNETPKSLNEEEDTNYTQFDMNLDTVNVTLSFTKWFNSKGLLANVEIKGVRGVIDRRSVHWDDQKVDPKSYRHEHNPGDFELDSFKLEDLLVTVHQPGNFRPFSVSIFSCDIPQLRRQWMFYDFLCANHVSGSFDESLFTIHPRQMHGHVGTDVYSPTDKNTANPWKKHSRMRIDGLNIDHLNRGVDGPFSWINKGNVDVIADVLFPSDTDESIVKVMGAFYDQLEATLTSRLRLPRDLDETIHTTIHDDGPVSISTPQSYIPPSPVPPAPALVIPSATADTDRKFLVMDLRINFNDIHAAVPLFTQDLSYVSSALIRPIVAYLNSRKTFIPITCRLVKRVSDYNGSWTLFDSSMMDDLSAEVYTAIVRDIQDDEARIRRLKKVGLWSLQLAVQALFMGLAGTLT